MKRYQWFSVLVVVAMLFGLMAGTVSAQERSDVTVWVEDTIVVTVASGGEVETFYHRAGGPVTKSLPVSNRYVFSAANCKAYDIMVLEDNKLVGASWLPDQIYTPGGCVVDHPGEFVVIRESVPRSGYSLAPAPAPSGNELQLRVVDPKMQVVVQDGDQFVTFNSRPEGVTEEMPSEGPYVASARNCYAMDLLIFDEEWNLVGRSFELGQPYTQFRAPIPGPGMYWVFRQVTPARYVGGLVRR